MGRKPKTKPNEQNLKGLKYFNQLMPLLERLRPIGTAPDKAGNRKLFFDHYCAYILLFLFNPIVDSLRGIQQASQLNKVQKKLGCPRASMSPVLYQKCWLIEIFFHFLKHILGCRHLLSTDPVGIEIQAYCAIIACLLIALWTGKTPTKRTYEMLCWYFMGWADDEELMAHLDKLKEQSK